jgi:hypothetical protein
MSVKEQLVANNWNFAVQMLYHPLMGAIRASIIMFLFRMMDQRRRIRYSLHVVCQYLQLPHTETLFNANQSGSMLPTRSAHFLSTYSNANQSAMSGRNPPWTSLMHKAT